MQSRFRFRTHWLGLVLCLGLVSAGLEGCGGGSARPVPQWYVGTTPIGEWGESSIDSNLIVGEFLVTSTGGTLNEPCNTGTLSAAPVLDATGSFDVPGMYQNRLLSAVAAHYHGVVQAGILTLTITPDATPNSPLTPRSFVYGRAYTPLVGGCP